MNATPLCPTPAPACAPGRLGTPTQRRNGLITSLTLIGILALTACGGGDAEDASAPLSSDIAATAASADAGTLAQATASRARVAADGVSTNSGLALVSLTPVSTTTTSTASTDKVGTPISTNTTTTTTTTPGTAAATGPTLAAPYTRLLVVNPAAANANDAGPATASAPLRTLRAAMARLQPGDDVVIAPGTYRESVVVPALNWGTAKTRIRALTPRSVLIKGSVVTTGWTLVSGTTYSVNWTGEEPQMVFLGTQGLQQVGGTVFGGFPGSPPRDIAAVVASQGTIWPGRVAGDHRTMAVNSFYFDRATQRLYVRLPAALSAGQTIEVSALRHTLIADNAQGLTVSGLDFAHANTSVAYRWGAVKVMGHQNLIDNITVRDMDAVCVQLIGNDSALTNSIIERCGQVGVTGRGARLRFEGNQILRSNTRGFDMWWEAGGMKLIGPGGVDGLNDSVIRNNTVAFNNGNGIWVDWKNARNLIEGNTTAYNTGFGIQYEASQTGTIRNNLAYGNGLRGIYLLESSDCVVEGNAVFGNAAEGIGVVDGDRSAGDAMLKPFRNQVIGNTIAWNDFNRNWVQLVLPGRSFETVSNRNVLKAERLAPRLSLGFVSGSNPAYERLAWWQDGVTADLLSTTETVAMPTALRTALTAKRLLVSTELPPELLKPGIP